MRANARKKVLANESDARGAPSPDLQPASTVGRSSIAGARLQQLLAKGLMVGSDQEGCQLSKTRLPGKHASSVKAGLLLSSAAIGTPSTR